MLTMSGPNEKYSCNILKDGHYRPTGTYCSLMVVEKNILVLKNLNGSSQVLHIHYGNFGVAEPGIADAAGQGFYNLELRNEKNTKLGIISQDGQKIRLKGIEGPTMLERITEEEVAALEKEGDPMEAPPLPYKIQPKDVGKLLWITGAPGVGKSTTAQLLAKTAGYVYYEADCFFLLQESLCSSQS